MAKWVKVAREDQMHSSLGVIVGKQRYALFRLEDGIYAMDDVCSHEYSLLSEGEIWAGDVYCPKHGSKFDIKTGAVKNFPATKAVKTYPVKVEDQDIYIQI